LARILFLHGLHFEFKFYIRRGRCVVLIWHDSTCKNWSVVKKNSSHRSCFAQTLLISSYLSSHLFWVLAELKRTPTRSNLAAQSKYIWLKKQWKPENKQKQNCDDSLASSKRIYPKYELNWRLKKYSEMMKQHPNMLKIYCEKESEFQNLTQNRLVYDKSESDWTWNWKPRQTKSNWHQNWHMVGLGLD